MEGLKSKLLILGVSALILGSCKLEKTTEAYCKRAEQALNMGYEQYMKQKSYQGIHTSDFIDYQANCEPCKKKYPDLEMPCN